MADKKTIVVYFSRTGTTEKTAKEIARLAGADICRIETVKKYPKSYLLCVAAARLEKSRDELPPLAGELPDLSGYQRVVAGFPVWWFSCPAALLSFFSNYDLAGKEILPFCRHGGGGPGKSRDVLEKACRGAEVRAVFDANKADEEELRRWLAQ